MVVPKECVKCFDPMEVAAIKLEGGQWPVVFPGEVLKCILTDRRSLIHEGLC